MPERSILRNNLDGEVSWRENIRNSIYSFPILRRKSASSYLISSKRAFSFSMFASIQFFVLTTAAIFFYPGGSIVEPEGLGYSFFKTFYSELGMTITTGGKNNITSALLFAVALTFAGLGISVFYLAIQRFFWQSSLSRVTSMLGTVSGVISGILYVAVAWSPVNLFLGAHFAFAMLASQTFFLAVLCYIIAIFNDKHYPNKYGMVYLLFAILLSGYLYLSAYGPRIETSRGFIIQATFQKIIVLSAITCKIIQSWGAIKQKLED